MYKHSPTLKFTRFRGDTIENYRPLQTANIMNGYERHTRLLIAGSGGHSATPGNYYLSDRSTEHSRLQEASQRRRPIQQSGVETLLEHACHERNN